MIVIELAQFLPTVFYLSPWMQSAAATLVCVLVCPSVCVPARDSASLFGPLWQLADVLVTVSECGSVQVFGCLWVYEKLSACSPAWFYCEDAARKRWVGGRAWGGLHSSPQTALRHRVQCECLLTNCEFVRETLPQRGVWVVRTEAKSVRGVSECV